MEIEECSVLGNGIPKQSGMRNRTRKEKTEYNMSDFIEAEYNTGNSSDISSRLNQLNKLRGRSKENNRTRKAYRPPKLEPLWGSCTEMDEYNPSSGADLPLRAPKPAPRTWTRKRSRKQKIAITKRLALRHPGWKISEASQPERQVQLVTHTIKGVSPNNMFKVNQDSVVAIEKFLDDACLFGVFDGHGIEGDKVSNFLSEKVGFHLLRKLKMCRPVNESFCESIIKCDESIWTAQMDDNNSGSTLCMAFLNGTCLTVASVGDSRCLILSEEFGSWSANQVNTEHTLEIDEEQRRVLTHGGWVEKAKIKGKPSGPLRVWQRYEDRPGLAMSRSIGDHGARDIGVICTPEIVDRPVCDQDKFILVGSDGVFEWMSNQQIADFVGERASDDLEKLVYELCEEAKSKSLKMQKSSDDISCVIARLG